VKLVIGCGYLGSRVAQRWRARGNEVAVLTRSTQRARQFADQGFQPIVGDVTDSRSLADLRQLPLETVLIAVGHDRASANSRRAVYVDGLRNTLNSLPTGLHRLIFASTIGVYGQSDATWLDENSACQPATEGGRLFLEAEDILHSHAFGPRSFVLRLAGLYGPGRIPRRQELIAQAPIPAIPDAFLNLLHVDDAARAVLAVEEQTQPPRTYVLSDGCPVTRHDYYEEVARLLGAPTPQFGNPLPGGRGGGNKRLNTTRFKCEVRFEFLFPTFKQGLAAIFAAPP
jgi:nucleoside-diphosphate-sugar epimerase